MENETENTESFWKEAEKSQKRGKIMTGVIVVFIGLLFLGRELGATIPHWIFTWKMLLIALGLVVLAKNKFQSTQGLILMLVGATFLISDQYPQLALKPLLWPIMIILLGLFIIFKPHRKHHPFRHRMGSRHYRNARHWSGMQEEAVSEDRIDVTTVMGAVKKNVLSKSFKGGSIRNTLGGSEINLSQADFDGTVVLEISNVLGGTQLIIPANWTIQSEVVSIMGSIEDERPMLPNMPQDKNKILILKGNVFMGGIEIRSY